jgi:hypothetical protein
MFNKHLTDGSWRECYCDLPVDPETASLYIMGMSAWATLIGEDNDPRMWVVQHDIAPLKLGPEQPAWNELPLPAGIIGKIISISNAYVINRYIIMRCIIHFPVKSDGDDQSFSEDICKRKAIIVWDTKI